jgi:hypothetical protein
MGSLLDTELYGPNAKTQYVGAVEGDANAKIRAVMHRFYGDTRRPLPKAA